ncbi:Cd(II)/Pb(II)-responsive transcriptional regulator [Hahella sp. CR1]|uniref:Cd(II)/Pb(II)-responsive transcriptional regulator n=1 Tax=Hahella sp. CR1 TaxID=2992807 RepID=UPI002440F1D2|nr:Cd(II)/Pb(II)-responsive transcriptional regulator [Hahella sp. CR1]MDG9670490.1 Cd(II)/Pb(II)-responsive transcriptional regulator [Hahella sp. CR1]
MRISVLAKATNCDAETVRYYEKIGLLPAPPRSASGYREYGRSHLERLNFIRHCRSLDMSLNEIKSLLYFRDHPSLDCGEVNNLVDTHLLALEQKISDLEKLREQLQSLRDQCQIHNRAAECGILTGLNHDPAEGECPCHGDAPNS